MSAIFSADRRYRYLLRREWDASLPAVSFVMLNPSTADETRDDPTIRRCLAFARAWRCGSLNVLNLFALRATDPRELRVADDPIGPENDWYLDGLDRRSLIVAAWGEQGRLHGRGARVAAMLGEGRLRCLGKTKSGEPRHPLYLAGFVALESFA